MLMMAIMALMSVPLTVIVVALIDTKITVMFVMSIMILISVFSMMTLMTVISVMSMMALMAVISATSIVALKTLSHLMSMVSLQGRTLRGTSFLPGEGRYNIRNNIFPVYILLSSLTKIMGENPKASFPAVIVTGGKRVTYFD